MDQLSNQVEHSFPLAQQTENSGQPSSENAPTSRRQSRRRQWASRLSEENSQKLALLLKGRLPEGIEKNSVVYSLCYELAENSTKKRLNVSFVSGLMGLPEGWVSSAPINSEALETWLSRSREHLQCLYSSIKTPGSNQ